MRWSSTAPSWSGLSQRLTRQAARFQACWHTVYDPRALVELLPVASRPSVDGLRPVATLDAAASAAVPELLRAALRPRRSPPSAPSRAVAMSETAECGRFRSSLRVSGGGVGGGLAGEMGENG